MAFTGKQTFAAETVLDVELDRIWFDERREQSKQQMQQIDLNDEIIDSFLRRLCSTRYPLLASESNNFQLYYSIARNAEEWYHWSVGKRAASEWQRANALRAEIESKFKRKTNTKHIMLWCRKNGFTPVVSADLNVKQIFNSFAKTKLEATYKAILTSQQKLIAAPSALVGPCLFCGMGGGTHLQCRQLIVSGVGHTYSNLTLDLPISVHEQYKRQPQKPLDRQAAVLLFSAMKVLAYRLAGVELGPDNKPISNDSESEENSEQSSEQQRSVKVVGVLDVLQVIMSDQVLDILTNSGLSLAPTQFQEK